MPAPSPGHATPGGAESLNRRLRILAGPCRSGTTALLHAISQSLQVVAQYQSIKSGIRRGEGPDYRLFTARAGGRTIVNKETFGPHSSDESTFSLFPSPAAVEVVRPVFLLREPVATWESWVRQGWQSFDHFQAAYDHTVATYRAARSAAPGRVLLLAYRDLIARPRATLLRLCIHWGLAYDERMVTWQRPLAVNRTMHGCSDFENSYGEGHFDRVRETDRFAPPRSESVLSPAERALIEAGPLAASFRELTGHA